MAPVIRSYLILFNNVFKLFSIFQLDYFYYNVFDDPPRLCSRIFIFCDRNLRVCFGDRSRCGPCNPKNPPMFTFAYLIRRNIYFSELPTTEPDLRSWFTPNLPVSIILIFFKLLDMTCASEYSLNVSYLGGFLWFWGNVNFIDFDISHHCNLRPVETVKKLTFS